MSLKAGDFFVGSYQLRQELIAPKNGQYSRWLAEDFSSSHKETVVLDIVPSAYDERLYWKYEVPKLRRIGQSQVPAARFFVWQADDISAPVFLHPGAMTDNEKAEAITLLDTLAIAPDELIHAREVPEVWRVANGKVVLFYRKDSLEEVRQLDRDEVREQWKHTLMTGAAVPVDAAASPAAVPESPVPKGLIYSVGAIIAIVAAIYLSLPARKKTSPPGVAVFHETMEKGMAQVKNGDYESAVQSFSKLVDAPAADELDARMDSLAREYSFLAREECERYKSAGSADLYFIPNQYFHYAAILSRSEKSELCE